MTRPMFKRTGAVVSAAGVAVLIAACGSSSSKPSTTSAAAPASSSAPASPAAPASSSAPASALTISTAKSANGTYLVGASGRALYLWVADTGGKSNCAGACASAWPPVTTSGKPNVAGGLNAAGFSTTTRSDGSKQVTYHGHPLYYFSGDQGAAMTNGQGSDAFGAKWWLVSPAGSAITSAGSAGSSGAGSSGAGSYSSTSSSSGGGYP
jgi:predicted lipoprotein with Yx(FWY)xxD motif